MPDYQKFVSFLNNKDISYSTSVEQSVEDLIKKSKEDKHYDDIKDDIELIKKRIYSNKANDLIRFKDEIREMLEQEIVSRYYFQKGMIEATFDDDQNILTAINILNTPDKYYGYLKPLPVKNKVSRLKYKTKETSIDWSFCFRGC